MSGADLDLPDLGDELTVLASGREVTVRFDGANGPRKRQALIRQILEGQVSLPDDPGDNAA